MLATQVKMALEAGLLPLLRGVFGVGKSSIIRSVAEQMDLKVYDIRLTTIENFVLSGIPARITKKVGDQEVDYATHLIDEMFLLEGDELPFKYDENGEHLYDDDGNPLRYKGVLYFFDEVSQVMLSKQGLAFKIMLEREVGNYKLHPKAYIAAAGNRAVDAGTQKLSEGILTRCIVFDVTTEPNGWLKWAISTGIHNAVISYIEYSGHKLNQYPDDSKMRLGERNFAVERTWENVSKLLIKHGLPHENALVSSMINGCIGNAAAADFKDYLKYNATMPKIKDILEDPKNTDLPEKGGQRYAMKGAIVEHIVSKDAFDDIAQFLVYMGRWKQPELIVSTIVTLLEIDDDLLSNNDDVYNWLDNQPEMMESISSFRSAIKETRL